MDVLYPSVPLGGAALIVAGATWYLLTSTTKNDLANNSDVHRLLSPEDAHWLWGHERIAWETCDSEWFVANAKELGLVYSMKGALFHPDILVMADPAGLNHIYAKRSDNYRKSPLIQAIAERLLGRGLLWAEGPTHKRQRALAAPFFSHAHLRRTSEKIGGLVERMCLKVSRGVVDGPTTVDMLPWSSKIALDIIGQVAFGFDFQCGESEESKIILSASEGQVRMGMTSTGFIAPLVLRALPWVTDKIFAYTSAQGAVKVLIKEKAAATMVERRGREGDREEYTDFLDAAMRTTDMDDPAQVDEMLDQITSIIIAGHETVAKSIPMILLELARQPALQDRLRAEILAFHGSGQEGRPTYDELVGTKLPLLDAVVREGLRFHSIVSHGERVAQEDDVIPLQYPVRTASGGLMSAIRVSKGQTIFTPMKPINTNETTWGPDGDIFDPTRWLEGDGRAPSSMQHLGGSFAFYDGPRMCIGHRLAVYEMKILVCEYIRRFRFSPTEDTIRTVWSTVQNPFVVGQRERGPSLPLVLEVLE